MISEGLRHSSPIRFRFVWLWAEIVATQLKLLDRVMQNWRNRLNECIPKQGRNSGDIIHTLSGSWKHWNKHDFFENTIFIIFDFSTICRASPCISISDWNWKLDINLIVRLIWFFSTYSLIDLDGDSKRVKKMTLREVALKIFNLWKQGF